MIRILIWNIAGRNRPIAELLANDTSADLALLQEVHPGGRDRLSAHGGSVEISPHEPWAPWGRDRYPTWPMVVKLSERIDVQWFRNRGPIHYPGPDEFPTSGIGTVAVARITPREGITPFIAASLYSRQLKPHPTVGYQNQWHSPATTHRIISDLSVFVSPSPQATHRIVAGGDLNIRLLDRAEPNAHVDSILLRMAGLEMDYLGPRTADNRPVPTFLARGQEPANATQALDHVFASRHFREAITVRALNGTDEWGSSDHCRCIVDIDAASLTENS